MTQPQSPDQKHPYGRLGRFVDWMETVAVTRKVAIDIAFAGFTGGLLLGAFL